MMPDIVSEGGTGQPTTGAGGLSVPLGVHIEALMQAERRFGGERDRRYSEVAQEREKALKIKETADLAALELAREIQTYKDEKANELRSQIERERGSYATKTDLTSAMEKIEAVIKPLAEYVTAQQARHDSGRDRQQGLSQNMTLLLAAVAIIVTVLIANGTFG